jgi:hypothetical protein
MIKKFWMPAADGKAVNTLTRKAEEEAFLKRWRAQQ